MRKTKIASTFILSGICVYIFSITFSDSSFDLNLHDIYMQIKYVHISIAVCIFLIFIGFIYFLFNKLNNTLGIIHLLSTIIPIIVGIFSSCYFDEKNFENVKLINNIITLSAISVFIGQIMFVVNIINEVYKKYF